MQNEALLLTRYGIDEETLSSIPIDRDSLCEIEQACVKIKPELESVGRFVVDSLRRCRDVHSITFRLKDNEHLIEKIIRKLEQDSIRRIDADTYQEQITDLVGIRALHLFKEDWVPVHECILDTRKLIEKPLAYVRAGDSDSVIDYYRKNGLNFTAARGCSCLVQIERQRPSNENRPCA